MRVARNDISLKAGLKSAQQEAEKAFKDGSVYLEKYIEQPRHIEVQILGRPARQRRPSLGARLFAAAPPSEAGRGIARPEPAAGSSSANLRRGRPPGQARRLLQCRHLRVPGRQEPSLLLHRGQRPHPGGASGDRAGHRASTWSREQIRIAAGEPLRIHAGGHRPPRLRHRVPDQRRGSRRRFSALARRHHPLAAAGRPGRPARFPRRGRLSGAVPITIP